MLTEQQEQELLENVKSLTDRLTMVDEVLRQAKLGRNMTLAFVCGASGLYFPGDYVKGWGKRYGIGLGPHPVSETLQSDYDTNPAPITPETRDINDIMHPLYVSQAQVDYMLVPEEELTAHLAILDREDRGYRQRVKIVRAKQSQNPKSKIKLLETAWIQAGRRVA